QLDQFPMACRVAGNFLELVAVFFQQILEELLRRTQLHREFRVAAIPLANAQKRPAPARGVAVIANRIHQEVRVEGIAVALEPCKAPRYDALHLFDGSATAQLPTVPFDVRVIGEPGEDTAAVRTNPIKGGMADPQIVAASDEEV